MQRGSKLSPAMPCVDSCFWAQAQGDRSAPPRRLVIRGASVYFPHRVLVRFFSRALTEMSCSDFRFHTLFPPQSEPVEVNVSCGHQPVVRRRPSCLPGNGAKRATCSCRTCAFPVPKTQQEAFVCWTAGRRSSETFFCLFHFVSAPFRAGKDALDAQIVVRFLALSRKLYRSLQSRPPYHKKQGCGSWADSCGRA